LAVTADGCEQHIHRYSRGRHRARSLWPANRQRISLVLGKPSFLNKPAHGLDIGAAAFSTQHFKFKLKTLQ
jgi:hypothetical protein